MIRIPEELNFIPVFAPQSVAAATDKTTAWVDAAEVGEIDFQLACAPLGAGKSLTVTLLAADNASGTDARELGKTTFTDAVGTAAQVAVVSYQVRPENGRYIALKFQHDGAAAVELCATAVTDARYMPAANDWTLVL